MSKRSALLSRHRLPAACSLDRDGSQNVDRGVLLEQVKPLQSRSIIQRGNIRRSPIAERRSVERESTQPSRRPRLGLATAFALLITAGSNAALAGQFEIGIGSVEAFPSETQIQIPILITNSDFVDAWQVRIEYDSNYLSLQGVELDGTVSSTLGPSLNLAGTELTVEYTIPLAAGTSQVVAYLNFDVDRSTPPADPNGSIETTITPGGIESLPLLFDLTSGSSVVPDPSSGVATIYYGVVLQLDSASGNFWDSNFSGSPIRVPIRGWSDGPIDDYLYVGLDYVDLFLNEADTEGDPGPGDTVIGDLGPGVTTELVFEPAVGGTPAHWILQFDLEPGTSIPVLDGDVLAYFVLTPQQPVHGEVDLSLTADASEEDGNSIGNLLPGTVTLEDHFARGDATFNGIFDINDSLLIFQWQFLTGDLICPKAADANDDGAADMADAIYLLTYHFLSGPSPFAPFPEAGADPTPDSLECLPSI